ncbi:glycoside hydrolase family 79 protein [Wolfiporia cocos MD-104 SS10]|uniref:Glycoside hydrolase family 79 protein n=1 Tax=Wolfiporia cocos (strain MD-104) TaxID=742152 RepID=A0A2H3IZA8_WOLCO|nr:glycoside hydrolase family 79 protein [Wolfiporia cocos MD-104 SS10]
MHDTKLDSCVAGKASSLPLSLVLLLVNLRSTDHATLSRWAEVPYILGLLVAPLMVPPGPYSAARRPGRGHMRLACTIRMFHENSIFAYPHAMHMNVSVPVLAPADSQPLWSTLLSFSIEQDRWPDWSGIDKRNDFVYSALTTYANLTGKPPKLRVGADSEDRTVWSPTISVNEDVFPPSTSSTPYPVASNITVGDEYYSLVKWLPTGTQMVWGVNLGLNNATNAINMAKAIFRAFDLPATRSAGVTLERIEVGNEADLYGSNGLRPADNWTVEDYVPDWESIADPVVEAVGISSKDGPASLQGAAFVSQSFTPREIFALGILNSTAGKTISTISQHQYSAAFCNGGVFDLESLMNKTNIRNNLTIYVDDIAATYERDLTYVIGETNSIACEGAPGVSNTAGAALWVIDDALFAATIGVRELYFHEGVGFKYNFIQPVTLHNSTANGAPLDPPEPPYIQPPYYGGLVVDTFVGSTGSAEIVELDVADENISGYAAFESGRLARAVFVNLHAWVANSTGTRPVTRIKLRFVDSNVSSATARRLTIQHADDIMNLTWAGQSYEKSASVSPTGQKIVEEVVLSEDIELRATEALLLDFVVDS